MAKVIAIGNHAGGVGKTTTGLNLAYVLASKGYTTLLVDVDPQGELTERVGLRDKIRYPMLARVLYENDGVPAPISVDWAGVNVDVLPTDIDAMTGIDLSLWMAEERELRLAYALAELQSNYEFIVLDLPPTVSPMTSAAFYATIPNDSLGVSEGSGVIIPVNSSGKSRRAIPAVLRSLSFIGKKRNLTILGLLITMRENNNLDADEERLIREEFGSLVFEASIPRLLETKYDDRYQAPLNSYSTNGKSALAYARFAGEVEVRSGNSRPYREVSRKLLAAVYTRNSAPVFKEIDAPEEATNG